MRVRAEGYFSLSLIFLRVLLVRQVPLTWCGAYHNMTVLAPSDVCVCLFCMCVWCAMDPVVTTFAGGAYGTNGGYMDGQGSNAAFNNPGGMAFDSLQNLYVIDFSYGLVRKISPSGCTFDFLVFFDAACASSHQTAPS